jgi:hypothetical protein
MKIKIMQYIRIETNSEELSFYLSGSTSVQSAPVIGTEFVLPDKKEMTGTNSWYLSDHSFSMHVVSIKKIPIKSGVFTDLVELSYINDQSGSFDNADDLICAGDFFYEICAPGTSSWYFTGYSGEEFLSKFGELGKLNPFNPDEDFFQSLLKLLK